MGDDVRLSVGHAASWHLLPSRPLVKLHEKSWFQLSDRRSQDYNAEDLFIHLTNGNMSWLDTSNIRSYRGPI